MRPIPLSYKSILAYLSLVMTPQALHAHAVWAEESPDHRVVLKFGDYGKKSEKSPGPLDRLDGIKAWSFDGEGKSVSGTVQKNADHLLLRDISAEGAAFAELTSLPVRAHGKNPPAKSNFYIRWQPAGASAPKPALTLDIVPTGAAGVVQVYLRGAPLAGAKVEIFTPGVAEPKEVVADKDGVIRFDASKSGVHVFECNHKEALPGFFEGVAYASTGHVAALTLKVDAAK